MEKKGQAAMEFLMTYGWAILAAIIAIGVLAYFGVFSPGKYAPKAAIVNPPFYANAWNVDVSAGITLEVKNNGGEDLEIRGFSFTDCTAVTGQSLNVSAGEVEALNAPTCTLTAGDSYSGDVVVNYRKEGSTVDLTSTGTISDTAVA